MTNQQLDPNLPLSVVLGAGGIRGLAHLGVLDTVINSGFRITEMVGTSVGALILTYYAAVGLSLQDMHRLGLGFKSEHVFAWALLRALPKFIQRRWYHLAGIIPDYLELLSTVTGETLFHGVKQIGLVAYDLVKQEEVLFHNNQKELTLKDALRGSVAMPRIFPPMRCYMGDRMLSLVDGGVSNRVPVDKLFMKPFNPLQILVVDVANKIEHREENATKISRLKNEYPYIPIKVVYPDTLGKGTVFYRTKGLQSFIDSGKISAEAVISNK